MQALEATESHNQDGVGKSHLRTYIFIVCQQELLEYGSHGIPSILLRARVRRP